MTLGPEAMRRQRLSRIALVPQGAMNSLNPVARVSEQIRDGLDDHAVAPDARSSKRISALLAAVGLSVDIGRRYPHELSGGMKQRVAIAIAISAGPRVLIADEPTSALDVVVQRQVIQTLARVQRELGVGVILVGHDIGLIAQFADRIGVMYAGRLIEIGPTQTLIKSPRHPYTRMLIESVPTLDARLDRLSGIPGMQPALGELPSGCAFRPRCPDAIPICAATAPALIAISASHDAACHRHAAAS